MNTLSMSLDESINYWTGRLTLAIGAGKFRYEVCLMIGAITQEAYERGAKDKARRPKRVRFGNRS